jgi:hypothetical protein
MERAPWALEEARDGVWSPPIVSRYRTGLDPNSSREIFGELFEGGDGWTCDPLRHAQGGRQGPVPFDMSLGSESAALYHLKLRMSELISDLQHEFRRHRRLAERAMVQLDDESFFRRPQKYVNPVAVIVKHLAGNLRSRWTDFSASNGDTPGRNRDDEFVIAPADSRPDLMEQWGAAWSILEETLASLKPSDLQQIVTIRGEEHSVQQALLRGLSHASYHTGQILYLVRFWKPDSTWLTIAPGESRSHKASYRSGSQ